MKKLFTILFFLSQLSVLSNPYSSLFAQAVKIPHTVDSLENLLNNAPDSNKIEILLLLREEYEEINLSKAVDYAHQALDLAKESYNKDTIAICYYYVGLTYWLQNTYTSALDYLLKALDLFNVLADSSDEAVSNLGMRGMSGSLFPIGRIFLLLAITIKRLFVPNKS